MNNSLLQKAIGEFEKLSVEDQNAVVTRWLEELKDEQTWAAKFANTTDKQWDNLAEFAKQDISKGDVASIVVCSLRSLVESRIYIQ